MEIRTLGHLSSKVWYRLVKVSFILLLVIALAVYNIAVFSNGVKNIDQNNTVIQCNIFLTTSTTHTFSPASIGISLSNSDFQNGQFNYKAYFEDYNEYSISAILKACAGTDLKDLNTTTSWGDVYDDQEVAALQNKYGLIGATNLTSQQLATLNTDVDAYKQETNYMTGSEKTQYIDFSFHMFDIKPAYSVRSFLEWFLIGNFSILIIFEIARRSFYYIVLGTLKPKRG
jgi:hypothetical protein